MKIRLVNGVELAPILATGGKRTIQGASRDTLSFIFSQDTSLDELDRLFTPENCETITILDGEAEFFYNAYVVRAELKREPILVTPATDISADVYENRVVVSMAQRTYMETQFAETQAALNALLAEEV